MMSTQNNNEWQDSPDSRFLFPDMFSFSFEPEILTFLWGFCAKKADDLQRDYRYLFPKTSLLQLFVPYYEHEGEHAKVLNFLRYTVITGGITVVVGFSSYGTYKILQKFRYEGFDGVKASLISVASYLKTQTEKSSVASKGLELVLRGNNKLRSTEAKRPSELILNGHSNGSPNNSSNSAMRTRLNNKGFTDDDTSRLTVTPINGDIISGDEDVAEVHSQYFGPLNPEFSTTPPDDLPLESLILTPIMSPERMLRDRYEALGRPCLPSPLDKPGFKS